MTPLQDPCYLLSVVQTLSDSLQEPTSTSTHDLLDAYATFSNRIRSLSQSLQTCHALPPALTPLKSHTDAVVQAFRRDLRLAYIDPFVSYPLLSSDEIPLQRNLHLSINIDTKQYARDASSLCHYALCALTAIFRFPAFHLAFSEHHLTTLLSDVLDIARADQLLVLNELKTHSLSLWALSSHRLSITVLNSSRDQLYSALQRNLDRTRQPASIVLDGLKALSHTLEHHPSGFHDILFPLLPHVIPTISCEIAELRLHAAIALGKFANALVHLPELSLSKWRTLSNQIKSFLESCCDASQMASENPASFSRIVHAALSIESPTCPRDPPTWILAVLASLIVLCGPTLYQTPSVLRFILDSLAITLKHKRSIVRALHPHVWRCFVWTFSQMLLNPEEAESASISSAYYVIKQEVSGGIGIALVNVLLSDRVATIRPGERGKRVSQALSVIQAMVQTECKHTCREGYMFLQALTNDTQARRQDLQNMCEIPASILLNGAIIGTDWDSLPLTIRSIPKSSVSVRWLEQTEIARNYKKLLVIWKHLATRADRKESDSGLVDVWLAVLLACSSQPACEQQIVVTTDVLTDTSAIITEFLPSAPLGDCEPDWGSWNVNEQLRTLTFIDQLWAAMRTAFVAIDLAEAAAVVLTSVLKYAFHILELSVRTLWGRLCANLMTAVSPLFLRSMQDLLPSQLVIRSQRELWGVVATSLSTTEPGIDCKELVKFLAIPICTWTLSQSELEVWEALLRNAITASGLPAVMIEYLMQHFRGQDVENWESIIPVLGFLLSCTCDERGYLLTDELVSMVDVCLSVSYGRARHSPELLKRSLGLLNVIRKVIVSVPGKVTQTLHALRGCLCLWIEDNTEVMSDDEFNSVAVPLYCETLKALEGLPLSISCLQDTETFLASAFSRIPTPAIAPFAFEKFWRATYHGRNEFYSVLPPKIKSCLACFVAAYGGDLADGLSLTTGSQSQSIRDGSQFPFVASHQRQGSFESSPGNRPVSNIGVVPDVLDIEVAPHEYQQALASPEDITSLLPSPDDGAFQPTVLRQLQEYSSQVGAFSVTGLEHSTTNPRMFSSPTFLLHGVVSSLHSPEIMEPVTLLASQKRKPDLLNHDDAPRKRSRTSRDVLRSARRLESEPITRHVTPVDIQRTNSAPPKTRMVFDGVQVPTFRQVLRQERVPKPGTSNPVATSAQSLVSSPKHPVACFCQIGPTKITSIGKSCVSTSLHQASGTSAFHVDMRSPCLLYPEADVDKALDDVHPSSPPGTQPQELDDEPYLPPGRSPPKAMSQSGHSPSAPARPSLRRAKTASVRLDALRDVYSSVANGGSQIPMSELVQATRLVHQIGAALTEQMGKKMADSG
ncbi:hypothetical protein JVU11DRAFT_3408 [Chiua virens]|nr:hypothetical protein JVU11DRAFT_3408 [Chiua virens]